MSPLRIDGRKDVVTNSATSLTPPPHGFAGNRFQTTADAIEAVKRLYVAGATRVYIGPPLDEPERIQEEDGPYADVLDIVFPKEKTKQVMAVVRSLSPD